MTNVSVIIPTYKRGRRLVRAVESVVRQTFDDWELVVVDDGSGDHTKELLAPFQGQLTYLSHPTNRGVAAARNTGIRESRAPLIAFLDSDDHWLPRKLAEQVQFFRDNPGAVVCQTEEIWIRKGRRVNPKQKHRKPSGDIFEPSLELCLVSPSAVMLRRGLLDKVGLFDEELPACEDYDLWLRIACQYPVHLIPHALVVKEGGNPDQLSARFRGMDRFRIRALGKLIRSNVLSEKQREAALVALRKKCRIYATGCLRRGRREEGEFYKELPETLTRANHPDTFPLWPSGGL